MQSTCHLGVRVDAPATGNGAGRTRSLAMSLLAIVACLLVWALIATPNAHAFGNTSFSIVPSTTQSAGHPNVQISLNRIGGQNEDIASIVVDLPPGLLANPEAVPTKCTGSQFNSDSCPTSAQVGTLSANATALGFLPLNNQTGTVYVMQADPTDAATLGYILRPTGSNFLGIVSKSNIKNHISVRSTTDYGLTSSHFGLPTSVTGLYLIPIPITIEQMGMVYQARTGPNDDGHYFMQNPSLCGTATSNLRMTSTQAQTATNSSSYTPTGCANTPFNPAFGYSPSVADAAQPTGGPVMVALDQTDATIQNSALKSAKLTFPQGTSLNFPLLGTLSGCTETQLAADKCPPESLLGTASALIPDLPPAFTGNVYAMDPIGATLNLAIVLRGARGLVASVRGSASVVDAGPAQRVVATFDNAPQIPIANLTFNFAQPVLTNPETCGDQTVTSDFTAWSGATATRTSHYTTVNCPPDTTIVSAPQSPTNDATPAFDFTASKPGATFVCAFNSGTFSPCASGQPLGPLTPDGHYLFRVKACSSPTNCDRTPAEYPFDLDTVTPSLTVQSPAENAVIVTNSISIAYTAEDGVAVDCQLDGGTWQSCPGGAYAFDSVATGPHTVDVRATDSAGNASVVSRHVTVQPNVVVTPDTKVTEGPRGGLHIDDRTPTFFFDSDPTGAPAFECSVDGGTWSTCASPITLDELPTPVDAAHPESHTFAVRAIGDNSSPANAAATTDQSPAVATFVEDTFNPTFDILYQDPNNNALPATRAASHPDVDITVTNPAGDLDSAQFALPDGFWGSLGAAPQCSQADVAAGGCTQDSKIGVAHMTAVTNDNTPFTFDSDIYMAEPTAGNIANIAGNMHIVVGGKDYGYLRTNAELGFTARYDIPVGHHSGVHNPKGMDATTLNLPTSTTGPDGTLQMHLTSLNMHFYGETGLNTGHPLLTSPSSCDPESATGFLTDKEGNSAAPVIPYQATDCASVPFNPTVTQTYDTKTPGSNTVVHADITLPDANSSFRTAVVNLPQSVQPQFTGLADQCQPADTELAPPACDDATMMIGTADVVTPLLPYHVTGKIYLEDSGAALPNAYVYAAIPQLGLDVRLRASTETVGTPGLIRLKFNAEKDGSLTSSPDVPISSVHLDIPGSAANGPIAKISTQCIANDVTQGTLTSWSGSTATYSQALQFGPGCPN